MEEVCHWGGFWELKNFVIPSSLSLSDSCLWSEMRVLSYLPGISMSS